MIEQSCRGQFCNSLVGRHWRAALALIAAAALLMAAGNAQAQLTTQLLIGDAVSEVGSRYSEVDQAIQRFNNRDIVAARQFLEVAKGKDAGLPPVDLLLAKMYILTGNAGPGRASLEKTAMDHPGDPEAYLILAEQAVSPQENRLIEAEALYDKALGLIENFNENPKRKRNFQIRARAGRATVYERRRDWPDAASDLQELLKVDPDNAAANYRLGIALFMQKQFREGYAQFQKARELDKNLPDPSVSAALMYDQLGDTSRAQQFFDDALKRSKTDAQTLTAYAQWLIKTGSLDRAEPILAEARSSHPDNLNILILSGVAARINKKTKPAEDYFMEALRISPSNGETLNQLALLLIEQPDEGKRQRALEFAGISARLNSQSADAQITLAWVFFQLGRAAQAEQAFREGVQLGFGNLSPDSSYLVARMLADRNPDGARQILAQAVDAQTPGIFVNRQDARTLLDTLERK